MESKIVDAKTWTNLELKGLLEDDESHVHFERAKRHLGLHPFHLTNLNAALREILGSTLYSYDTKLKGFILSYKNPKLFDRLGTVLYDTCYVHVDIEADFYVFRPSVGVMMKGIVNKKSQDHVGILVHKVFNVSIPRPDDDRNWPGHSVEISQEVRFTITCLDFKGRLPYIRGSMDALNYLDGCQLFEESFVKPIDVQAKPKKTVFSFNDDGEDQKEFNTESDADRKMDITNESEMSHDGDIDKKVSSRKQKKLKREHGEDEINAKRKKKQKLTGGSPLSDIESDMVESNQKNEDRGIGEELQKLKRENGENKISAKKKKKSKVKVEEISQDNNELNEEEIGKEYSPRKSKKLKRETVDENIYEKNLKTPKLEVEITYVDEEFDFPYENNGNIKIKDEHTEERRKKRKNLKVEDRTTGSDSDVSLVKRSKGVENRPSGERIKKSKKIKAEVLSSENECSVTEGKQSVSDWMDYDSKNIKKNHRIKTESRSSEVSE